MEHSFWFVWVGLAIFGLHYLRRKFSIRLGWLVELITGSGIGVLIGRLRPVEIGGIIIPLGYAACLGGLAALLLWCAERFELLRRDLFKHTIVIVLSLIHAFISYALFKKVMSVHDFESIFPNYNIRLFFQILLISAVSIAGYSFPARLLKQSFQQDSES